MLRVIKHEARYFPIAVHLPVNKVAAVRSARYLLGYRFIDSLRGDLLYSDFRYIHQRRP